MRQEPKSMQVYKHFKGNVYQIVTVAVHTETGEKLVIYRPLYQEEGTTYARPLSMFLSEVDKKKYPEARQKYRFELMEGDPDEKVTSESISGNTMQDAVEAAAGEEAGLNPLLEKFLDADSYTEKLDVLYEMKGKADLEMLSYVATSLDIEVAGDDVAEQYAEIQKCLKTMVKYECNRLRS